MLGSYLEYAPADRGLSLVPPPLQQTDTFEFYATEHFRLSGVYWGLTGMAVLGRLHDMDEAAIVGWVRSCQVRASMCDPRPPTCDPEKS